MITCKSGVTIRTSIASIREAGRATQGVKLIRLDDGDEIAAITKIDDHESDDESEVEEILEIGAVSPGADVSAEEVNPENLPEDYKNENSDNTENNADINK